MNYYLAPSLVQLRSELNRAHPDRDKASDGWIGNTSHQARKSDHNPDYSADGVVRAIDIDEDGPDLYKLLGLLVVDHRVQYVIYESFIYSRPYDFRKREYSGVNSHSSHMHVSIRHGKEFEDDTRPWGYEAATVLTPTTSGDDLVFPTLRRGDKGQSVRNLQGLLLAAGRTLKLDGDFGPTTERLVKEYQRATGLVVDGLAGTKTFRRLLGV